MYIGYTGCFFLGVVAGIIFTFVGCVAFAIISNKNKQ